MRRAAGLFACVVTLCIASSASAQWRDDAPVPPSRTIIGITPIIGFGTTFGGGGTALSLGLGALYGKIFRDTHSLTLSGSGTYRRFGDESDVLTRADLGYLFYPTGLDGFFGGPSAGVATLFDDGTFWFGRGALIVGKRWIYPGGLTFALSGGPVYLFPLQGSDKLDRGSWSADVGVSIGLIR